MIEGIVTVSSLTNAVAGHGIHQDRLYSLVLLATVANSSLFWQWWVSTKRESN